MPEEYLNEVKDATRMQLLQMLYDSREQNKALQQTVIQLNRTVETLNQSIANMQETINELKRKLFAPSSEKTKISVIKDAAGQDPGENGNPGGAGADDELQQVSGYTRTRKKKATRDELYDKLPIVEELYPLTEDQKTCPECGSPISHCGQRFVREEIRITPAKVERVQIFQETGVCYNCRQDDITFIIAAPTPEPLLPHSPLSQSIAAFVICDKFAYMMPSYRQEMSFLQLGVPIPRETISNWIIRCSLDYLLPVYERLHEHLLMREILHADEVPCQVLHEEGRAAITKSYFWIYVTGNDGEPGIILYDYQPSRSGDCPKEFLKGFSGFLQCDGYTGYNKVLSVILVCCLAHLRRKFYEAIPPEKRKNLKLLDINSEQELPWTKCPSEETWKEKLPAQIGFEYCNHLFFLERGFKDMSPEERRTNREKAERPVWESFWKWIATVTPTGGSKLEKAVYYATNHKELLMNYLLDGRCEISNNRAERRAKAYVQGRKNFLFHDTVDGAKASAIALSLVETAKANNLNVFQYLYVLLLYLPDYKDEPKGIEALMPWSDFIKEKCSGLIDTETITIKTRGDLPI